MRITAYHRHTGHSRTLFRTDNVYDALARVENLELLNTEGFAVLVQCNHLFQGHFVSDAVKTKRSTRGWNIVIRGC